MFTADYSERRGKWIPLKEKIDQALEKCSRSERSSSDVWRRDDAPGVRTRDEWRHDFTRIAKRRRVCRWIPKRPPCMLYTSGTTGKPKGCGPHARGVPGADRERDLSRLRSQAGGPVLLAVRHRLDDGAVDHHRQSHFGGTIFLYDGAPDYPGPDRLWEMIERHRITTFGVSPTAIRMLMRRPANCPDGRRCVCSDRRASRGTRLVPLVLRKASAGRCPVINISGGTEIVGCFLFPLPIQPLKACTLGGPAPGMATEVVDESGEPVRGRKGYLVCTKPAPSMTRGIWGDPERYLETYWSPLARACGITAIGRAWMRTDAGSCTAAPTNR